jgi:quercetin dioxygenase-like cupin family protein
MPRTNTTSQTTFTRPGTVTYTLPAPSSNSTVVTITLPPHSPWTSGLHWHETHTEYLQVIKGSAQVTLNNTTRTYKPRDGIITVPRFARHEWKRAPPSFKNGDFGDVEDVVVKEWTEPGDGEKEVFFRNLSGVIADESRREGGVREWWLMLQLWVVFYRLDNWPVLVKGPARLEWCITHLALWLAAVVGCGWWGLRGAYEEYTPRRLMEVREEKKEEEKGK